MKTPATYIVAKYARDLARMEPRNIGVFLWSNGELAARFLNASDAAGIVTESDTYQRWFDYWMAIVESKSVSPLRGRPIDSKDDRFIEALLNTQKGNYILVHGGELLQKTTKSELPRAVDHIFNELVAIRRSASNEAESFTHQCDAVFHKAGVPFTPKKVIKCTWKGVTRPLHAHYFVGDDDKAVAILQRAQVRKEESVNSTAMFLDLILNKGIVPQDRCRVLLREADVTSKIAEANHELLSKICPVVHVDSREAINEIKAIGSTHLVN